MAQSSPYSDELLAEFAAAPHGAGIGAGGGVDVAAGGEGAEKLMAHIKSLQQEVKKGREIMAMRDSLIATQAQLREEAEEAKFYQEEAEAKSKDMEDLASQLWGQLDAAGIDPEANLKIKVKPRAHLGGAIGGASEDRGEFVGDPEVEEIQRKLLEADEDLAALMQDIMAETVEVEMAAANAELAKARQEVEDLKRELGQ